MEDKTEATKELADDGALKHALDLYARLNEIQIAVLKWHTTIYSVLASVVAKRLGATYRDLDTNLRRLPFMTWVRLAVLGSPDMRALGGHLQRLDSVRNEMGHSNEYGRFIQKLEHFLEDVSNDTQLATRDEPVLKPITLAALGPQGLASTAGNLMFRLFANVVAIDVSLGGFSDGPSLTMKAADSVTTTRKVE